MSEDIENILEVKNVTKHFGKKKIIDNISFNIRKGEIFGFLGPNGAGKTTTIKMILGLLSIDEGNIKINGYDVKKDFENAMQYVGGIVENPDLYGYMTAVQNLKMFAKIRNIDYKKVYEALELVGLKKSMNQKISKYSLGMKQRAGLALCLLHSPKLLILDEPTNGLDPNGIRDLREILTKLAKEQNTAILVSSHILSEMELMCDTVCFINDGKIAKIKQLKSLENTIRNDKSNNEKNINNIKVENKKNSGKVNINKNTNINEKNSNNNSINSNEIKTENVSDKEIAEKKPEQIQCVLNVNKIDNAKKIIEQKLHKKCEIKDGKLYVLSEKGEISNIIKTLVLNDIEVNSANEVEKSLEDIFVEITEKKK